MDIGPLGISRASAPFGTTLFPTATVRHQNRLRGQQQQRRPVAPAVIGAGGPVKHSMRLSNQYSDGDATLKMRARRAHLMRWVEGG